MTRTVDFRRITGRDKFAPVPEGSYRAEVIRVDEAQTKQGEARLDLRLRILDGEHRGALLFDRIHFTERALPRLKLFLEAVGVGTDSEVEVTPDLLEGKRCLVDVIVETYTKSDGSEGKTNSIPFRGYHPINDEGKTDDEAIIPF